MFTTYDNIQIERQSDREEKKVGTGRFIHYVTIDRDIDREILRQRGGGGRHRQMYTTYNNRQIERYLDREQEEVGTERCIQL